MPFLTLVVFPFKNVGKACSLTISLFLLLEGKMHDAGMLMESNLLHQLERSTFSSTGEPLCLYGDPAYPLRVHLQAPFRGAVITPQMQLFNSSMSAVRTSVEIGFLVTLLTILSFLTSKRI